MERSIRTACIAFQISTIADDFRFISYTADIPYEVVLFQAGPRAPSPIAGKRVFGAGTAALPAGLDTPFENSARVFNQHGLDLAVGNTLFFQSRDDIIGDVAKMPVRQSGRQCSLLEPVHIPNYPDNFD